ncbi:CDP-glycerol glycerophosphotransferase family protein [Mammaliicoccus lentus]|jgi:CDP-glycerol glycerophosphotransferase (TagB/SpsB family)|uniref:CDP-glycerol glycerophosphotransferase family protein n=1 Tax=Mammaliicoccus lentus TaxID=42858 RepID=UPI0027F6F47D|nr:CDP-glycerol glycerophosphotransferase family protein [Mammaliicoccus lentus]MDQ7143757.1 CDP-glycerol glycerophosphotransferase family protein [Mammaliicoccus lentus]
MLRNIIKQIYLYLLYGLDKLINHKIKQDHVVVFMTFKEDVLPIIKALKQENYKITIIAHPRWMKEVESIDVENVINLKNKYLYQQIKSIKSSKTVIIDTYYLLLGGIKKNKNQKIIQTWHAAGALKTFGLEDKSINQNNKRQIKNYLSVYQFTDYYLVSSDIMKDIFIRSLGAKESQMLPFGLPRLDQYKHKITRPKQDKKIALYVPTYRDYTDEIVTINKQAFEQACPEYQLITKLHPSINSEKSDSRDIQTLVEIADVIITDYSSLSVEASLLDKPIIFYSYDEDMYNEKRGLNEYYYEMTKMNKAFNEDELFELVNQNKINKDIKPMWHKYTEFNATEKLINFIQKDE